MKLYVLNLMQEDKRCVFTNGKCEAHYNECSKASQNECNDNIPQDSKKKCNWDSSCQEKYRECNNYIIYTDGNGQHMPEIVIATN